MFPPAAQGWRRVQSHRINNARHDDGDRARRFFGSPDRWHSNRNDDVHLQTDQLGRKVGEPVVRPRRPSGLNRDVLTFHIAQLAQAVPETFEETQPSHVRKGARRQKTYSIELPRQLRLGGARRRQEHSTRASQECPPIHHWIISSGRCRSDCGIVRPRILAVFRLMMSSNFVGCSIGRVAGLAPLRILST